MLTECSHQLHLLPGLPEHHIDIHLSFPAVEGDVNLVAGAVVVHYVRQVLLIGDLLAIYGYDQVAAQGDAGVAEISGFIAAAEASSIGGAAGHNTHD